MSDINNVSLTNPAAGNASRPVSIGPNGGGLAAGTGTTMTVSGYIETSSGSSPLIIGVPASTANGNVNGLVPGTGGTTANPALSANGTVALTAANGYFGGTVLDSGTLNINGQYAVGGADYGGITFNGGTLQYATAMTSLNGGGRSFSKPRRDRRGWWWNHRPKRKCHHLRQRHWQWGDR